MKALIATVALIFVAVVTAEHCKDTMDCNSNNCATGTVAVCTDRHVCTCDNPVNSTTPMPTTPTSCLTRDECTVALTNCLKGSAHCVDGICMCGHPCERTDKPNCECYEPLQS